MNTDVKTMDIPINMQRVFNPLVEAATLRLQDTPIGNFNVAIEDVNVSSIFTHPPHSINVFVIVLKEQNNNNNNDKTKICGGDVFQPTPHKRTHTHIFIDFDL